MNITQVPLDIWKGHDPEGKFDTRAYPIKYIVLHTTGGTNSVDWLSKWNRLNPASEQNGVSIHYLISRTGLIYAIIGEEKRAWHVGVSEMPDGTHDGNSSAIGIELEHKSEPDFPDEQMDAVAELVYTLMTKYNIDGKSVVSHASVARPVGRKVDPVHFDWADFWNRVLKYTPVPAPVVYSEQSPTMHIPEITDQDIIDYVATKKPHFGEYTQDDIRLICNYYRTYGKHVGVDWLFALAQSIHETGWFSSWWAARPRRNPAGIGVTGQTRTTKPVDPQNWVFDSTRHIWKRGQSFASWDIAVQHHISRLLCYALTDGQMTAEQLQFSKICQERSTPPNRIRGCAPILLGFNGTWAVPGKTYAQTIAGIINSLIKKS